MPQLSGWRSNRLPEAAEPDREVRRALHHTLRLPQLRLELRRHGHPGDLLLPHRAPLLNLHRHHVPADPRSGRHRSSRALHALLDGDREPGTQQQHARADRHDHVGQAVQVPLHEQLLPDARPDPREVCREALRLLGAAAGLLLRLRGCVLRGHGRHRRKLLDDSGLFPRALLPPAGRLPGGGQLVRAGQGLADTSDLLHLHRDRVLCDHEPLRGSGAGCLCDIRGQRCRGHAEKPYVGVPVHLLQVHVGDLARQGRHRGEPEVRGSLHPAAAAARPSAAEVGGEEAPHAARGQGGLRRHGALPRGGGDAGDDGRRGGVGLDPAEQQVRRL
mmetsp:Transcript_57547/g.169046  ORF Transcript_57547/g.169046 Transcript_57547/m.169046 type:complete len:331 (-) Transcript_57547:802-1794(-)